MMKDKKPFYILTQTAEKDFVEARKWSQSNWGRDLTRQYFTDLHEGAEFLSKNHHIMPQRYSLTGDTGLSVYPVREHYIVYLPVEEEFIIIVSFLRKGRDIPSLLRRNAYRINQDVKSIMKEFEAH